MSDTYVVNDLEGYAQSLRKNAALSFSEKDNGDLDEFITIEQIYKLIDENAIGFDDNDNYIIDEDSYHQTFDQIRTRFYNVGLARLAAAGYVECAWDDATNDMIFWVDENKSDQKNRDNGVSNEPRHTTEGNQSPKRKDT
jgi:hypothetical protein